MDMGGYVWLGKFLKEWQVIDEIIESVFFQFTYNLLWMIQTQEKSITGFQKLTIGYEGMCMNGGNFLMEWQVTDKITEQIFFLIYIQPFTNNSNSKNNHRVLKIHEWIWGDVYEWGKFLKEWQVADKITE